MRRWLLLLAWSAVLPMASALADDIIGVIKAINPEDRRVTLEDDTTYLIQDAVDLRYFLVGDSVQLTYDAMSSSSRSTSGVYGVVTKMSLYDRTQFEM